MSNGSCLTSKPYDKIIKMLLKSHETIPLSRFIFFVGYPAAAMYTMTWSVQQLIDS
jgi:hypothetical protein